MTWTLVTGPVRSGKSRFAEQLAARAGRPVTYVATAGRIPGDPEWEVRLERHRRSRPATWTVVETAGGSHCALTVLLRDATAERTLIVDSLGTWLADRIASAHPQLENEPVRLEASLEADCTVLVAALADSRATAIVVGEETGWGIVPVYPSARVFRDVLGRLQQRLAARATHLYLVVSGFAIDLHSAGVAIPMSERVGDDRASRGRNSSDPDGSGAPNAFDASGALNASGAAAAANAAAAPNASAAANASNASNASNALDGSAAPDAPHYPGKSPSDSQRSSSSAPRDWTVWARAIGPSDVAARARARAHIDELTKPVGALGRLEELAVQLCGIAGREPGHAYTASAIVVAAGDHGVSEENVSAYPAAVTPQMVAAFTGGYAAINAFARVAGADLFVADFGIRVPPAPHPTLFDVRVGAGTANLAREPALTGAQVDTALNAGIAVFEGLFERRSYDVLALGEMGIGNTTSAAAVVAAVTGALPADVVGYGTGIDADAFARKVGAVERALARFEARDWHTVAREVGGFEIVGLAGLMLAAARRRVPVVLDGFIVAAAALLACGIEPAVADYCIAAHVSTERGHRIALAALGLRPLLDLELRLGEATGAALALPLIEAATRMLCEMKTFAEAGVATAS